MILVVFAVLVVTVLAAFLVTRILALLYAAPRLASVESVLADRVAIVFGAGLRRDGTPSPVLRDRIATAARLYFEGKVEKLLMSGDNRFEDYNEPGAMKDYALELGIPAKDIVLDYAGRRTYDTCYRARDIFRLNSAILVTQAFHLPRALYICNQLGLPAVGVPADQREYRQASRVYWSIRETLATMAALWEVHVTRPVPVLGDPEPIFPQEAQ
jgi:SanA protein